MSRVLNSKPIDYFDNRPVKESLERSLYSRIGSIMTSNVLQITGPALERHYENALKIASNPKCKIYWIEAERQIFEGMSIRFENLQLDPKRVKLRLGDVTNYERVFNINTPARFEDLDFCGALSTTRHMIAHRLLTQSRTYPAQTPDMHKCLMFTASIRPDGMEKMLPDIQMILKEIGVLISPRGTFEAGSTEVVKGIRRWIPIYLQTGNLLEHLWIYSYKDTHQMMTCAIIYKTGKGESPRAIDNGDGTGSLKGKLVGMGF